MSGGFRGEVKNASANQSHGRRFCFSDRLESINLVEDVYILLPVSEEKSKKTQQIRCQGGHLAFPIGPKNTNLLEEVEILVPVKFRLFRKAVSEEKSFYASTNQSKERPSWFSDLLE